MPEIRLPLRLFLFPLGGRDGIIGKPFGIHCDADMQMPWVFGTIQPILPIEILACGILADRGAPRLNASSAYHPQYPTSVREHYENTTKPHFFCCGIKRNGKFA